MTNPQSPLGNQPAAIDARSPQLIRYCIFIACAGLYLLPFMRVLLSSGIEGSVDYAAVRIVHGQVFARDFFEVMGPGTPYWLAAFFKLFGVTFMAARICLFVTSLGSGILIFYLSSRVCESHKLLPCLLVASTIFSPAWPGNSHHIDSNFFALLSVAFMVLWQGERWNILLIAAGAFAGLTTFFLQPKGILLFVAMLVWLWMQRRKRIESLSSIGLVAGGYLGASGIILAYFWSQGALSSLVYANIVWPSRNYGAVNTVPYAQGVISWYWNRYMMLKSAFSWPFSLAVIPVSAILIVPLLFIAALPVLMPISALLSAHAGWKNLRTLPPEIVLYLLCGFALWFSEFHRRDIVHLMFGSPLLIILCVYFLDAIRNKYSENVLQILAITSVWLAAFNLLGAVAAHSQSTRAGSVAVYKNDPVLAFIDTHVRAGEEIFVYPYHPMYYFLSSTINPTRYSLLIYGYNTDSEFYDAISSLELSRPRYVLWETGFGANNTSSMPALASARTTGLIMEPYLESHYGFLMEENGYRIMMRKGVEAAY